MIKYGLIGYPLTHSFSKLFFSEKFKKEKFKNVSYDNFEIKNLDEIKLLIKNNSNLRGLNVTIPYKEKVLEYLDHMDEKTSKIGAVNVIKIVNNKLVGSNTDYLAFKITLQKWGSVSLKALILGTGGSSRAVSQALKDLKINHKFVSRIGIGKKNCITYDDITNNKNLFSNYNLIINTTPLGMYPNVNSLPKMPYELISNKQKVMRE